MCMYFIHIIKIFSPPRPSSFRKKMNCVCGDASINDNILGNKFQFWSENIETQNKSAIKYVHTWQWSDRDITTSNRNT